jgi:hypothetical protein
VDDENVAVEPFDANLIEREPLRMPQQPLAVVGVRFVKSAKTTTFR